MLLSCLHSFRAAEEWIGDRMRWNPVVECWMNCFVVFTSGVFRSVEKMLRRKPTRLELKIDDIEEFESVKKELEVQILFFLVWSVFSLINRNTTVLSLIRWFFCFCFRPGSVRERRQSQEAVVLLWSVLTSSAAGPQFQPLPPPQHQEQTSSMNESATSRTPNRPLCPRCLEVYSFNVK